MRIRCFSCGAAVSTEIPEDTIFRATATCPECEAKKRGMPPFDVACVATIAAGVAQRNQGAEVTDAS